ncbi:MAG: LysM peptidoglycan-binding domain-containing protein [Chloroflexota bacterium]|nr:LysM peptidoglycan-binding domain-containing protein [Chloroflexota bacterium]
MNRRQLAFVILVNAVVSLAIALGVAWAVEARRPDPEELAALAAPLLPATAFPAAPPLDVVVADSVATVAVVVTNSVEPVPTAAPVPTLAPGEGEAYVVQAGDSLLAIAQRYNITLDEIIAANGLKDANYLFSGQQLIIPVKGAPAPAGLPETTTLPTDIVPAATPANGGGAPTGVPEGLQIQTIDAAGNLLNEAALIVNESAQAFNLQGWRLERENGPAYTFGAVQLFQGSSVWVHSGAGTDTSIALYWQQAEPIWQSGTLARLVNPQGEVVATYAVP